MKTVISILLLGALTQVSLVESASSKRVVCYQGTWSVYRPGNGTYGVSNIDPTLCTHVVYSFIGLYANGSIHLLDSFLDIDKKNFENFVALTKTNPDLKVMIAIGGWNEGSTNYSTVVSNETLRATFVKNVVSFLGTHGFHGFDLDWEYPAERGGKASDKENFSLLVKELKAAFKDGGYILSAAVRALGSKADISYEVPVLNEYLDFINIMTYDYHVSSENVTGHVSPLYRVDADKTEEEQHLNINASIHEWIERGASPENINLGIPFYGRAYTLANSSDTGLGAPVSGPGTAGPYTQEAGTLGYHEALYAIELCARVIAERQLKHKAIKIFSDSQAALKALDSIYCTSKAVWNCKQALGSIRNGNRIHLVWIPGHAGHEGNEVVDLLAKRCEIVEKRAAGNWTYVFDEQQAAPHIYNGDQWVGYVDVPAIEKRVAYAKSLNLGGLMVWSLETDDFHGVSGTVNPLLKATNKIRE